MREALVIIDGQNDFIENGKLAVAGGTAALDKIVNLIKNQGHRLNEINATLDSHRDLHIAHPIMWIDSSGNNPAPFTMITLADIDSGKYRASKPQLKDKQREYVEQLEQSKNRFPLIIWPPHCLIATEGAAIYAPLRDTLGEFERNNFKTIEYVTKGSNPFREHYSAIKAEVVDPNDLEGTGVNTKMIARLQRCDKVYWTGIAGSHCLNYTFRDTVEELGDDYAKKFVILEDCTVPVANFESAQDDFFNYARGKGAEVIKSTDL